MRSIFAAAVLALASIAALLAMASAAHAQVWYGPYWYPNYSNYPPYAFQPGSAAPDARSFRNPYDTPYSSAFTTYCDSNCQQRSEQNAFYSR